MLWYCKVLESVHKNPPVDIIMNPVYTSCLFRSSFFANNLHVGLFLKSTIFSDRGYKFTWINIITKISLK